MNAKDMLDKATKIIARADVTADNRSLLLFFMNTARRAAIRDNEIPKLNQYLTNVPVANGIIDAAALNIKAVRYVEHDNGARKSLLGKFDNYEDARDNYPDFTQTGIPRGYLEIGTKIYILPVPNTGTINLVAEVWPADLTDGPASDILTTEIPEAWIYLAAAEYLDYWDEMDKGNYWRQKGLTLLQQYILQQYKNYSAGAKNLVRPYGHHERIRGYY